jgi:iron complex transport system substrate-binding protein
LFALGLDEEIVGVTEFCNYPPEAQTREKIGGYSNPNLEKIVSLKPDLILADYGNPVKGISQIENLGYTLVGLNPKTIEDILHNINLVGNITGKDKEASELIANMKERLNSVAEKMNTLTEDARSKVLYVIWYKPLWIAGSGTFINELIKRAGGLNVASDLSGYKQMSLEAVIERNPQVIVVGESKDQPGLIKTVKEESALFGTNAFRNNQIYTIDTDIVSRPGPRIVDALEQLAKLLHPEMFEE